MSIQNLAIVFGPTLFSQVAPSTSANGQMNGGMADAGHQNKVRFGEYSIYLPSELPQSGYSNHIGALQGHLRR